MRPPSIWKTLGISRTQDRTDIRRAYAKKLKVTNPEDNPEGFKVLRAAYEQALDYADNRYVPYEIPDEAPEPEEEAVTEPAFPPQAEDAVDAAPPPVVDAVAAAYFAASEQLEKQLSPRSDATDDDRAATLAQILSSPMLDNLETRDGTETWLAQLVSRSQPRSDALIPRLVERFGWNSRRIDRHQSYLIRQVLQRELDLAFLRSVKRSGDGNSDAWHILSRPPETPSLWRRLWPKATRSDIKTFLSRVRNDHPTILKDLNADSLRAWEERSDTRDLFDQIRTWSLVTFPIGIFAMLCAWLNWGVHPALLAILAAIPVVAVGGAAAYEYGYHRAHRQWQENWRLRQNSLLAIGWGPALIFTLLLAAAPPSAWLSGIVALLSVAVVWWSAITGEPDRSEQSWPWQVRLVLAEFFLVAWWASALWDVPVSAALQMTPPVIAATLVAGFGRMSLYRRWLGLSAKVQSLVLCLLVIAICGAINLLWRNHSGADWRAPAFAVAATVLLLHRIPTAATAHWTAGFRNIVAYGALFLARTQGGPAMTLAFTGTILLLWAGLNVGLALYNIWRKPTAT